MENQKNHMDHNLIGISGKINSGKDTVGQIIQYLSSNAESNNISFSKWEGKLWGVKDKNNNYPFKEWKIKKFGGKLKQIASLLTGIPVEKFEDQEFKKQEMGEEWDMVYQDNPFYENGTRRKLSVRKFLQRLGTEAIRNTFHSNAWVNALFADYKPLHKQKWYEPDDTPSGYIGNCTECGERWCSPNKHNIYCKDCNEKQPDIYPNWIITDVRFPNEYDAVKERGGIVVRIKRGHPDGHYSFNTGRGVFSTGAKGADQMEKALKESLGIKEHPSETALDKHEFDWVIDNNGSLEDLIEKVKEMLKHFKIIE